jgi:serine/threonine protein kinase
MVPDDVVMNMKEQQRNQFFEKRADGHWALKAPTDVSQEPVVPSSNPRESLKAILRRSNDSGNYDIFVNLIYKMLAFRPSERITPTQALGHPFIIESEHSQSRPVSTAS